MFFESMRLNSNIFKWQFGSVTRINPIILKKCYAFSGRKAILLKRSVVAVEPDTYANDEKHAMKKLV